MQKTFLELPGGGARAGIFLAPTCQPNLLKAHDHTAEQAQPHGGIALAHPTLILRQGHIQRVRQPALNDPIAPLEFEDARRRQLVECQAADQVNDFGALLILAPPPVPRRPC